MPVTIDRIRQFFTPPVFPDDEDRTRTAANLFVMLRIGIGGIAILALVFALLMTHTVAFEIGVGVLVGLLYWAKRGHVRAVAYAFVLFGWASMMVSALDSGGVQAVGYIGGGMLSVLLAGLLLHRRHIFTFFVLTVLFGALLAWLQSNALLPPPRPNITPISRLIAYSLFLLVAASVAFITVRSIQKSLDHARTQLAKRAEVENALRESEERFRMISSVISDYTFSSRFTAQGELELEMLTGAFEAISGYTPEEFLARGGWSSILHPDDVAQDERDKAALQQNQRIVSQMRIITRSGEVRWVRVHAVPVWDEQSNRLLGINGGVRDITEIVQAEEALRESEARFRTIFELAPYGITVQRHGGVFTDFNQAFLDTIGLTAEQVRGKSALELKEFGDPVVLEKRIQKFRASGNSINQEMPLYPADGRQLTMLVSSKPLILAGERIVLTVAVDVTERKRLEAELQTYTDHLEKLVDERTNALRRAKEQLELILNTTSDALAFAHPNGDTLMANPAFLAMFDERADHSIEYILSSIADDGQVTAISDALLKVIYNSETQRLEAQIVSRTDHLMDVDLTLIPVQTLDDDSRNGVLLSGHDITQMKEIERFKARFVADALHDLATPISGLSTRLYLLQRNPERLPDHVRALENQVQHLRNLLDDLRTLSRVDRGQMTLNISLCDVGALAQRVFDTYEPVALEKQQSLRLNHDPALPDVRCDAQQIERVLVNLVANAINYTPENKDISIETRAEGQHVVIRVADQGAGISAEDLPHIFERFYRTDEARKSLTSGTGLGLAIAKEIVELHGGTVFVTSEVGQGSTFTVQLPLST